MSERLSDEQRAALCRQVDESFEAAQVPWLAHLVDTPSYTREKRDVEVAAAVIDERVAALGFSRQLRPDPDGQFADHRVYASPASAAPTRALALVGHCDTVFPRSLGFLKFERDDAASESGGDTIRGPGTLDMKSGLSVVVFALEALRSALPEVFSALPVRFICNTDEEVGSPSSRAIFDELAPLTSAALVFEGGREGDRIITARKGSATFRFEVKGKEAHAGNEHAQGLNAIHALSVLIPQIEALTDYERGTLVNVGLIEGGTAKNTVPGRAACVVDARASTRAEAERVTEQICAIAEHGLNGAASEQARRLSAAKVELSGGFMRWPMEASAESVRLCERYGRHATTVGLGAGQAPQQGGGSDANLLAALGVPVIDGLGPFGRYFHSVREHSSVGSLRRKTQALACFLATWG
jgi:glutamate carboxypeptidase